MKTAITLSTVAALTYGQTSWKSGGDLTEVDIIPRNGNSVGMKAAWSTT